jgi:hypothetical protein
LLLSEKILIIDYKPTYVNWIWTLNNLGELSLVLAVNHSSYCLLENFVSSYPVHSLCWINSCLVCLLGVNYEFSVTSVCTLLFVYQNPKTALLSIQVLMQAMNALDFNLRIMTQITSGGNYNFWHVATYVSSIICCSA